MGMDRPFLRSLLRPFSGALGRSAGGMVLGAELAPALSAQAGWIAGGTGAAYTGGVATFTASSSTAVVEHTGITALDDNATYFCEIDVSGYTQGAVRLQVYGDTTNHLGTLGPFSANGTFTGTVTTTATGTLLNRIRIQTNGPSSPGNTLNVTRVSVKRVL